MGYREVRYRADQANRYVELDGLRQPVGNHRIDLCAE